MSSPRKLFVAGATGAIGQVLVPLAAKAGIPVVAHARSKSADRVARAEGVTVTTAGLGDPAALTEAMKGCTTVVQLIGTMRHRFSSGDTYEASDIGTTRQLVEAAKATGTVDHVVLLSSAFTGLGLGAYLKAKQAAEKLVRDSGLSWTVVRPNAFEDREQTNLKGLRSFTEALGLRAWKPIKTREVAIALLAPARDHAPLSTVLEGGSLWDVVEKNAASFPA
ncbi:MAG: NAD(P)-binding oxidoreductase [Myxococcaceae bacterium]